MLIARGFGKDVPSTMVIHIQGIQAEVKRWLTRNFNAMIDSMHWAPEFMSLIRTVSISDADAQAICVKRMLQEDEKAMIKHKEKLKSSSSNSSSSSFSVADTGKKCNTRSHDPPVPIITASACVPAPMSDSSIRANDVDVEMNDSFQRLPAPASVSPRSRRRSNEPLVFGVADDEASEDRNPSKFLAKAPVPDASAFEPNDMTKMFSLTDLALALQFHFPSVSTTGVVVRIEQGVEGSNGTIIFSELGDLATDGLAVSFKHFDGRN